MVQAPVRAARWRGLAAGLCLSLATSFLAAADTGHVTPDFAALARQAIVSLPPPPPWTEAAGSPSWSVDELQAELGKLTDTPPRLNMLRTRLLRPDRRWVTEFARWFKSVQKPLKIEFHDQAWDCDDYANCFVAFADLLVLKAGGNHGGMCVGRASVYYQKAFQGIRAGGAHALVMVGTNDGVYLLEPQDGTITPLKEFPNRHSIEEVNF